MALSLFTGVGTVQVDAATYTSGNFSPTGLKEGDIIYKGVGLRLSREAVVCTECQMVWISGPSGGSERRCAQIKSMPEHSEHADKVYANQFLNFFGLYLDSNPVKENVPYTVVENGNLMFTITYNTNGGSTVSAIASSKLPNPLPETTKEGYDFAGWYTDASCETAAVPGASISQNTTLYAKWKLHEHTYSTTWTYDAMYHWHEATCSHTTEVADEAEHTYGETGIERYTCTVCDYVDSGRKAYVDEIEDVKTQINSIGKVTYEPSCYDKIKAARRAYNALIEEQQAEIADELKVLTDAEAEYARLETEYNEAQVAAVVEKIDAIGEVEYTDACKAKINAATRAYSALNPAQEKLFLSDYSDKLITLMQASSRYSKLKDDHDAADAVAAKIKEIGTVYYNDESKGKIDDARAAYNALTEDQKALISSDFATLTEAETRYAELKAEYEANLAAAKAAEAKIDEIGTVEYTTASKTKIEAARAAVDALTPAQSKLLSPSAYTTLTTAERTYAKLDTDYKAAKAVADEINAIGTVEYTKESKAKIEAARASYGELTADQKKLVSETDVNTLEAAESSYAKLEADHNAADAVVEKINAIQTVDKNSGTKIDEARKAYKNLTADQKALITEEQYKVLTDAESAYEKIVADYRAANVVVGKIAAIGTVEYTQESKKKIDEAREAYKNLTPDQQNIILTEGSAAYKVLTDAEAKYAELKAADDAEKAAAAVDKIEAIKKVEYTTESKAKIDEAKDVYDALTEDQKKLITEEQYKVLIDAEASYAKLKADTEAAKVVSDAIKAIGTVDNTKESKAKIDAARAGYDKLSDYAKTLITEAQYKVLTDAESTYAKLESSAEYRDNSLTMNSKFKIKAGKSVKVSWGKVKGADGYDVYLAYRGKGKKYTVKSTKASSVTVRKLKKKAINQKKNIKCYVVAYKKVNGKKQQIGKTKVFYAVGNKIKSATEPKAIQLKKSSYVLTVGKTAKVKATIVKKNKRRKLQKHTAKFRYATSDSKVAVVSKTGKITAKAAGTCKVYVYAANGCAKVVKVTVR